MGPSEPFFASTFKSRETFTVLRATLSGLFMARRRRAGVSKPSKPSTDVGSDGTHHINAKPASQVALPESAPDEDTLNKIANLIATLASKPEDFYRRDDAVAKVSSGRNGNTHLATPKF